jgi:hypothetical protein
MCYMPHPSHIPWYHLQNIWWVAQIMKSPLCTVLQSPLPFYLLDPNIFLSTLFSNTLKLCSSYKGTGKVLHPFNTTNKIIHLDFSFFVS